MGQQASINRAKDSGVCRDSMHVYSVIRSVETSKEASEPGIIAILPISQIRKPALTFERALSRDTENTRFCRTGNEYNLI